MRKAFQFSKRHLFAPRANSDRYDTLTYGEDRPEDSGHDPEARRRNRELGAVSADVKKNFDND